MERLWTPWRREFIEGATSDEKASDGACFLCQVPADHDDARNLLLHRGEHVFTILNRYPYNTGHLMIAPYEHTGDFPNLDPTTASELIHESQRSVAILRQVYTPDAFNAGMNLGKSAGAGVPDHLHVHVVPRWSGDTNFMPVIAQTKVLPETLDQTYERLAPLFQG
ncbi:MAG: HIT domain-containing protein [Chloroflexi bacterium]|nr:HIT domain-containing protein [Chloroflexota bacterium]MBV9543476.1 HIT domain-containing protein [Chloroflexota bacterium]